MKKKRKNFRLLLLTLLGAVLLKGCLVQEKVVDPTIPIDQDYDFFNGWTELDPSKREIGSISIKNNKTIEYSLGENTSISATNFLSHVELKENGKTYYKPFANNQLMDHNYFGKYKLKGYFKKNLSMGMPAFLAVFENFETGEQISYLIYGNVRVRVQNKNVSLSTKEQELKEQMELNENFPASNNYSIVRSLGNNRGMFTREVNQANLLQKARFNVSFDSKDLDYSHWASEKSLNTKALSGWENKNSPEGVFNEGTLNPERWMVIWKNNSNLLPSKFIEGGYTIENVDLDVKPENPSIPIIKDFDYTNGLELAKSIFD